MELTESPNDDRTVMAATVSGGTNERGSQTGADNALPVGTALGEFEIIGLIGEGGFGIVYLAYDHSLHRKVALKEYMPAGLASRKAGMTVAKSRQHVETFQAGLRSFINEARLLAQFDHPSLVKVHRFWEANGTAYMVMPFYEGGTLKDTLREAGRPPDEFWLKQLLKHLLDAVEIIHSENCFHRDISPDNILMLKDGRPLLLDFGAARRVISNMTQNLTVILKPGFAPIEQYAEMASMKQGAWTDIYALGAVIYFAVAGKTPPPAVSRIISDSLEPLFKLEHGRGHYSSAFLVAIDKALAVKPEERPQSIAEFRELLNLEASMPSPTIEAASSGRKAAAPTGIAIAPTNGSLESIRVKAGSYKAVYASGVVVLIALVGGTWFFTPEEPRQAPEVTASLESVIAERAPPADPPLPDKPADEIMVPVSPPESHVSPAPTRPVPSASSVAAPEVQKNGGLTSPREFREKLNEPDKNAALPSQSSGIPSAAAPLTGNHEFSPSTIEKIVSIHLVEGRACLDKKNFECAIAKAETALQLAPENGVAGALLKDARAAQQKAWEASELE